MSAQANEKGEVVLTMDEKGTIKKMEVTSALFVSKPTLPLPFIGIGTQHVDIGRSPGAPKNAEKDRWDKKHLQMLVLSVRGLKLHTM
jgi:hypothetical protein